MTDARLARPAKASSWRWLDWSAIGLSGLCVAHCLLGVVAIGLLAMGAFDPAHHGHGAEHGHDHTTHVVLFLIAAPLAVVALWRGWTLHRRRPVLLWGGLGLGLMLIGVVQPWGHWVELGFTLPGVLILAFAHILNVRWGAHRHG
jgi:hypothetical protein